MTGFFADVATAALRATFAQSFSARLRGGGTGLVIGIGRGGAALGPIVAGLLFPEGWPFHGVASIMAFGCLIGAVCLARVRPAV